MNITAWVLVGMIIGVISTGWYSRLSVRSLLLSVIVGVIGAVSGGVMGYLFYGASISGFNLSVFSSAIIITCLVIISKRKVVEVLHSLKAKELPSGSLITSN